MEVAKLQYIKNQALIKGEDVDLLLYDMIGRDPNQGKGINSAQFIEELFFIAEMGPKAINIRINSPGGNLMEGINIFNAISLVKEKGIEVNTFNDGMAASIATPIFLNGTNVFMADHAIVMIHLPKSTREDAEANKAKEAFTNSLATILSAKMNKTKEDVTALMELTTFFDATEAVAAGMVEAGNIIETTKNGPAEVKNLTEEGLYNFYNNLLTESKPEKMDKSILALLGLENSANTDEVVEAIKALQNKNANAEIAEALNLTKDSTKEAVIEAIEGLQNEATEAHTAKVEAFVNSAIEAGKFGEDARESLTSMANTDFASAEALVASVVTPAGDITNQIKNADEDAKPEGLAARVAGRTLRDLEKEDAGLLNEIYNGDLDLYKSMFKAQYGTDYAE